MTLHACSWLSLFFSYVFLLSCSDQLVVDSENTVLAVANLWMMRGPGGITADQVGVKL